MPALAQDKKMPLRPTHHEIPNRHTVNPPDTTAVVSEDFLDDLEADSVKVAVADGELTAHLSTSAEPQYVAVEESPYDRWEERDVEFNPDPTRAVWISALFPGLGQLYNRRYWKLPIIIGGYMGLVYATSWNNTMLSDYTVAYRDIMDSDPSTNSYMNLFPPNTKESDIDKSWLTNVLQSRKNYFRRNRDLCIISMVGVYLLAMVDAYVDASLSHFDISPDLSMDVAPMLFQEERGMKPSVGLSWAINF
ncbi:MAG: hypothetical protein J1F05_06835 [Muribaculaceae bacterium]|nr:hypothetical protein [Muribaculaceae bacterium]